MRRARKRSDHGAVYSRDVKIVFPILKLDEPLLTEFAKDLWMLAQRRCGRSPSEQASRLRCTSTP
jgi:hypothetical protein